MKTSVSLTKRDCVSYWLATLDYRGGHETWIYCSECLLCLALISCDAPHWHSKEYPYRGICSVECYLRFLSGAKPTKVQSG